MDFFERFCELIENKGVTIYEISSKTGIGEGTLGRLAKGETKKPNQKNAETLAKYFNVSLDWFKTGVGEKGVFEVGIVNGDNNVIGNENKVTKDPIIDENLKAILNEMAEQRKAYMSLTDKLLSMLEKKQDDEV